MEALRMVWTRSCLKLSLIHIYQVIRYSYAAGCGSFAAQPHSMWGNFPLIDTACARLQKVVVENTDFEKLIRDQGFDVRRADLDDVKRLMAVYFVQDFKSEHYDDFDGQRWVEWTGVQADRKAPDLSLIHI